MPTTMTTTTPTPDRRFMLPPGREHNRPRGSGQLLPRHARLQVWPLERGRRADRRDHVVGAAIAALVGLIGCVDLEHRLAEAGECDRKCEPPAPEIGGNGTRARERQ